MKHSLMKIIAHRGDSTHHAENTPASWSAGYSKGAHAVEADIRFLRDGTGICSHDPTLKRLFDRPERVEGLSIPELQGMGIGPEHVGLFADVLRFAEAGRPIVLDLKDESPRALELIWEDIQAHVSVPRRHNVIVGCHSRKTVAFFAAKRQVTILALMPNANDGASFFAEGATIIRLWESDVTDQRIRDLKALGGDVWVTTGSGETDRRTGDTNGESLRFLSEARIDGVLVNDVALSKSLLEGLK